MAFVRGPGPAQEPPQHQPRGPLLIGVAVLLLFFVPLLVVTAARGTSSAPAPTTPTPDAPIPPMPPAGAPWPPPLGAPQPPVCVLVYQVAADGRTAWTAMTTQAGQLAVGSAGGGHRQTLPQPEGVAPITLPASLAQDHDLRATLSTSGGQHFGCLVGRQRAQRRQRPAVAAPGSAQSPTAVR